MHENNLVVEMPSLPYPRPCGPAIAIPFNTALFGPSEEFDLTKMSWGDYDILLATSHDYFNGITHLQCVWEGKIVFMSFIFSI